MCNLVHTDVSLRRPHGGWGNSKNLLDGLARKAKFSDDLLVGESGQESVRPSVDADFVAGHVLLDQDIGFLNNAGTDHKESGRNILLVKEFEQFSIRCVKPDM